MTPAHALSDDLTSGLEISTTRLQGTRHHPYDHSHFPQIQTAFLRKARDDLSSGMPSCGFHLTSPIGLPNADVRSSTFESTLDMEALNPATQRTRVYPICPSETEVPGMYDEFRSDSALGFSSPVDPLKISQDPRPIESYQGPFTWYQNTALDMSQAVPISPSFDAFNMPLLPPEWTSSLLDFPVASPDVIQSQPAPLRPTDPYRQPHWSEAFHATDAETQNTLMEMSLQPPWHYRNDANRPTKRTSRVMKPIRVKKQPATCATVIRLHGNDVSTIQASMGNPSMDEAPVLRTPMSASEGGELSGSGTPMNEVVVSKTPSRMPSESWSWLGKNSQR